MPKKDNITKQRLTQKHHWEKRKLGSGEAGLGKGGDSPENLNRIERRVNR